MSAHGVGDAKHVALEVDKLYISHQGLLEFSSNSTMVVSNYASIMNASLSTASVQWLTVVNNATMSADSTVWAGLSSASVILGAGATIDGLKVTNDATTSADSTVWMGHAHIANVLSVSAAGTIFLDGERLIITGLPSSDPGTVGRLYTDDGTVLVSAGP